MAAVASEYPSRVALIAVDDGSGDDSATIIAELADEIPSLHLCRHEQNAGYGAALRTGAEHAAEIGLEYLAFIDSDLTNPPEDLLKMGELASHGDRYIKGSRFIEGGGMESVPMSRKVVSRAGNLVASCLFGTGLRDITNGFRAVRTDLFLSWGLQERGFAIIVEEVECALRSGIQPREFATVLSSRQGGQRKSAFGYTPRTIFRYLRYPLRYLGHRVGDRIRLR
jgi:dolichol-phosphate mannosyltransferase